MWTTDIKDMRLKLDEYKCQCSAPEVCTKHV